jgi:hypothetical protein
MAQGRAEDQRDRSSAPILVLTRLVTWGIFNDETAPLKLISEGKKSDREGHNRRRGEEKSKFNEC